MKKIVLKNELYKAFCNKRFIAVIMIEAVFVIIYTISKVVPMISKYSFDVGYMWGDKPPYSLSGALSGWLPFSIQYRTIAFVILPILAAFPHGSSLYTEEYSKYNINVILRCGKSIYYKCKIIAMFISGAVVAAFMLTFSFVLNLALLPVEHVLPGEGSIPMDHMGIFSELFYKNPIMYIIIYILVVSIICGLLTSICFVVTDVFSNVFIVVLFPEMLHFSFGVVAQTFNFQAVTWVYLQMHHMTKNLVIPVLIEGAVLLVIFKIVLVRKSSMKGDLL